MTILPERAELTRAALAYLAAGWEVVPLPVAKSPPMPGLTGYHGHAASPGELRRAIRRGYLTRSGWQHVAGLALRMPAGVCGLDIDAYKTPGAVSLAALVALCGPLPPTWVTTSRGDGVSGIRLYRIPDGVRLKSHPFGADGGIETVQRHHRYACVWPTVHPDTGEPYRWHAPEPVRRGRPRPVFPGPGDLPLLELG